MAVRFTRSGIADWSLRLVPAAILAIAVPAKFIGDPGTVAIFTQLGAEPTGRVATGVFELVAVVLLLVPGVTIYGALFTAGLMSGAILSHLAVLGVAPDGDPSMFVMAAVAFMAASSTVWHRRREIPLIGKYGRADEASAL
jgi:uncharacterized membrane protein YphA (DoxX/SURF4 family)